MKLRMRVPAIRLFSAHYNCSLYEDRGDKYDAMPICVQQKSFAAIRAVSAKSDSPPLGRPLNEPIDPSMACCLCCFITVRAATSLARWP